MVLAGFENLFHDAWFKRFPDFLYLEGVNLVQGFEPLGLAELKQTALKTFRILF